MATSTLPRRRGLSGRWLAAGIIVAAVILVAVAINGAGQRVSGSTETTVQVTRGNPGSDSPGQRQCCG